MWNYRIIKREVEGQPDQYGLFEVFYNDDGEISAHAEEPEVVGESSEDIIKYLNTMLEDANKYKDMVLEYGKIKFAPFYDENEELIEVKDFKDFLKLTNE